MVLIAPPPSTISPHEGNRGARSRIGGHAPRVPRGIRPMAPDGRPVTGPTARPRGRAGFRPRGRHGQGSGNDPDVGRRGSMGAIPLRACALGGAEASPEPGRPGACDAPVRGGLGRHFKARGLDHQPHASELPRCLRSPAQQAEVEAAWSAEPKCDHERAEAMSGAVASGALRTYSCRRRNAFSSTAPPVLETSTARRPRSARISARGGWKHAWPGWLPPPRHASPG